MTNSTKQRALFLLLLTALITMLLAAALPHLELQKGIPLPGGPGGAQGAAAPEGTPPISVGASTFAKVAFIILLLLMAIYILTRLRARPDWKEIARIFLLVVLTALALTGILFAFAGAQVNPAPLEAEVLPTEVRQVGPALAPLPAALIWLVWAGLAGTALLLVIAFLRHRSAQRADPLVLEAEQAVQALLAGQDLRSVIIHCYRQMSLILREEQELTRGEAMTAREFEALLESRGVPRPPVSQLTRLFEMARYGADLPGQEAEQQAIESLNAIIQFSKKTGAQPH